ncbi:MAG: cellulase family glycosylhydrolase [Candidatus Marinimicrobia bacterium]|nr:cellulase family glycosylhydrolase [Candidatus Neomarinimicrobiota bacterium]
MIFKNPEGEKIFLLGVNYWPSSSGLNMWSEWSPDEIAKDFNKMRELGMNVCRFFIFMPDFLKGPKEIDATMMKRLTQFLEISKESGIYTLPSFIVGHMSGEDWDVQWRKGRNFITDSDMIEAEKFYIKTIVQSIKTFYNIIGWILTNEISNYIKNQSPKQIAFWVNEIISLIKALDPKKPVCIGDGAWAPEILGKQTDFHLRLLNKYQDFVGLHYYPREMNPWRHSFTTAFRLRMAQEWGKPVFIEEFGTSTTLASEENQAHYYRSVFYSSLINKTDGVLSWCLNDFDFNEKRPYSHHPYEERFGILRSDKSIKSSGLEFKRFRKVVDEICSKNYIKVENNAGLIIPSYYYYSYPYLFKPQFDKWYDFYLECFSLLKRSNIDVEMVIEPAIELENNDEVSPEVVLDPKHHPIMFSPRMKLLTKKFWKQVIEYVTSGGTLYYSFSVDSWVLDWDKIAGVKTDCKFGVPDFRRENFLEITVNDNWGHFSRGENFKVPLKNTDPEFSYCKILETTGRIIMIDQYGHPVLSKSSLGKGQIYFASYPFEMLSLASLDDSWKPTLGKIYKSIYEESFQDQDFQINGDGLEMGVWKSSDGHFYKVIILNHSWDETSGIFSVNNRTLGVKTCSSEYETISPGKHRINFKRKGVCIFNIQYIGR